MRRTGPVIVTSMATLALVALALLANPVPFASAASGAGGSTAGVGGAASDGSAPVTGRPGAEAPHPDEAERARRQAQAELERERRREAAREAARRETARAEARERERAEARRESERERERRTTESAGEPEGGIVPSPSGLAPSLLPDSIDMTPIPSVSCADAPGAPRGLIPIYREASERYGLGPEGPGILASINLIETRFGELNHVTSYAGAIGWMQFMPGTWEAYGVDATGDGVADPYNPRDAIFSAANYLSASGAPDDWYGAIFAYNRADWYVAEVLAKAGCYGTLDYSSMRIVPKKAQLTCEPAYPRHHRVPTPYMRAFERAAGRYELGRSGVWALAAIARIESDFGRAMTPREMRTRGPLNIDPEIWREYGVDGDESGEIERHSPWDSAATLARMSWSEGDLRAGVFKHNQAGWYVEAVMAEADRIEGDCEVTRVSWPLALPEQELSAADGINWDNLDLTRDSQRQDILSGTLDPRVMELLALITQRHRVMITSIRTDHSKHTKSGNVSNHYHGRAFDIAMVDGVTCSNTALDAPCSVMGRTLTLLPPRIRPTELIYCHDLDGPDGPAIAMADHCDHIHIGFHAN